MTYYEIIGNAIIALLLFLGSFEASRRMGMEAWRRKEEEWYGNGGDRDSNEDLRSR